MEKDKRGWREVRRREKKKRKRKRRRTSGIRTSFISQKLPALNLYAFELVEIPFSE